MGTSGGLLKFVICSLLCFATHLQLLVLPGASRSRRQLPARCSATFQLAICHPALCALLPGSKCFADRLQTLFPGGELFSHLHPSFHPGVCPSRIGACCVQPSAAGWVVSRAERPLPGVPAMHTCVGTYWMLRFWGPSTPAQRLEPVSVMHGHLIS